MKYFLSQDNDGHWYVIPEDKTQEWEAWLGLDPDDGKSWTLPSFAESVGGCPSLVRFSDYEIK